VSSPEWRDRAYHDAFERTLTGLGARRRVDPSFTVEDAEGVLRNLYVQEGNDWIGRGLLQDAVLEATIAAYEHYIAEWRAENAPPTGEAHERGA
jgi:hypothetical protein